MITASTPKTEKNQILQNLKTLADRRVGAVGSELKLLYVTVCFHQTCFTRSNKLLLVVLQPEKMSKDKSFRALLQRLDQGRKLGIYIFPFSSLHFAYMCIYLFSKDRD